MILCLRHAAYTTAPYECRDISTHCVPGKKAKDVPVPEECPVPMPTKAPTQMRKRGEEDEEAKYLSESNALHIPISSCNITCNYADDEPDPGPSCYVILTGFSSLELFQHLESIKLRVHILFQVLDEDVSSNAQTDNMGIKIAIVYIFLNIPEIFLDRIKDYDN